MSSDAPALAAAARGVAPATFARRWQAAAMGAGFFLFLLALASAFYFTTRTDEIRSEARHHNDVIGATRDLLGAVLDCEAGQRGYLLTHDDRYLAPYALASVRFKAISNNLAQLTGDDDAALKAKVSNLQSLVDAKIAELQETVNLEERGDHGHAMSLVEGGSGRALMEHLRAVADDIVQVENAQMTTARAALDRNALFVRLALLASVLIGFVLLFFVARARTAMLRDLARQNVMLEERVRERTAALEARNARIETLIQDVSHRVGNALSLVTGFLDLQARNSKSEEVKSALSSARQRVFSVASAQRRMRLAMDSDSVEASEYLSSLVDDLRASMPDHRVTLTADIDRGTLPSQDAAAFGVILNELIANALKHAWQPSDTGELAVRFEFKGPVRILTVTDDGRGDARQDSSGGLGQILVQSLVQSMRGKMTAEPVNPGAERPGLKCEVRAPVDG